MALATVIVSERLGPPEMLKLWLADPWVTAARLMPPGPTVIASVPALPTTALPAKPGIVAKFTVIVSAAVLTVRPGIGAIVVMSPAVLAAVIVSVLDAPL
jgi:hypothetical protein